MYTEFVQRALIKLLDGGHMTNLLLQLQNLLSVWNIQLTLFVHSSVFPLRTIHVHAQGCHCFTWCNNREFSEQVHLEMVSTHSPSGWWLDKVIYLKQCMYSTNFWDSPAVTKQQPCDDNLLARFQEGGESLNSGMLITCYLWTGGVPAGVLHPSYDNQNHE